MSPPTDDELRVILRDSHTIAVVGLSADPSRPSNQVFAFLLARGYDCVGVNPGLAGRRVHGAPVFANLAAVDHPIDMVDIFRSPDAVAGLVEEALRLTPRPRVIWTQLGVVDEVAAARARDEGLTVIMDRCPKIEIARLGPAQ